MRTEIDVDAFGTKRAGQIFKSHHEGDVGVHGAGGDMGQAEFDDRIATTAEILPFVDRVITKREINACCRYRDLLESTAKSEQPDLSSVLDQVRASAFRNDDAAKWMSLRLDELVEHILNKCHRPLGARLLNLETLIDMVEESHGNEIGDPTCEIKEAFVSLRGEILDHLLHEEDMLFPWIVSGNGRCPVEMIDDLKYQHKVLAMKAKTVAASASRLPMKTNSCEGRTALFTTLKALETDIDNHIFLENNVLYPRVVRESGR
jgi:regulator of cell morphogenesis and NO signaling